MKFEVPGWTREPLWVKYYESMRQLSEKRREINLNKSFDPEKYDMLLYPLCDGKGFVINPKRKCCQNAEDLGLLRKKVDLKETDGGTWKPTSFWDYLFHFLPLPSHSPPWL